MKKYLFAITLMVTGISLNAQVTETMLPIYSTPEELSQLGNYVRPLPKGFTYPPVSPIRNVAEWEEMDAVLISWKSGYEAFLSEIIKYSREEAKVYIYCSDSATVKSYLTSHSIPTSNTAYIQSSLNSVWIRDFGPNNVYTNDVDSLFLIDWVYNRNRPADDASPASFATRFNVPLYEATDPPTDLVATGGNFMSDGFGTAFSSKLILNENATVTAYNSTPKTEADVNQIASDFLGIDRYIKFETLPYDDIHHIDMHMKILDEQTILVGEFPAGVADGPQIALNLQYLQNNFNSVFGTPYKIIRIPMPPSTSGSYPPSSYYRTYTNSLILNKTVLVPTYYQAYDTIALRIYREAMPGYRIIGINANSIISQSGTIHCTSHEIATKNPLLISHQPLIDNDNIWTDYEVNALIQHRSGIASANIYYTTDTLLPYTAVPMSLTSAPNNTWTGYIPVQPSGTTVYYYIDATSVSGKHQVRPIVAPDGYWEFYIYNPTSMVELNESNFIMNPYFDGENNLHVNIQTTYNLDVKIDLMDISGRLVTEIYSGPWNSGNSTYTTGIENITPGCYLIRSATDRGTRTEKIFIR
jgi:agmatine/peptidylarginine deiminase